MVTRFAPSAAVLCNAATQRHAPTRSVIGAIDEHRIGATSFFALALLDALTMSQAGRDAECLNELTISSDLPRWYRHGCDETSDVLEARCCGRQLAARIVFGAGRVPGRHFRRRGRGSGPLVACPAGFQLLSYGLTQVWHTQNGVEGWNLGGNYGCSGGAEGLAAYLWNYDYTNATPNTRIECTGLCVRVAAP